MKKLLDKNEFYISCAIVILCVFVQLRSGQFFTSNNIVDIIRAMIIPTMLSVGAFIVILSGGIDVSFTALASLSMYVTTRLLVDINFNGTVFLAFIVAALIGLILGAFNGFIISKFRISTLIVTLGTLNIFRGIMSGALNATDIMFIPKGMKEFGEAKLFTMRNPVSGLTSNMPVTVLLVIVILIISFFLLKYTMWGRSIYAIGGNENSATTMGIKINKVKFLIYCFVGIIAGITGITRVCMVQACYPNDLLGMELTVIAAIVLGGTSITGGIGTLFGTVLGIGFLTIMSNSLMLLGIPSYWQNLFTGLIIIVGTGISASQVKRAENIRSIAKGDRIL